jgi:hypothetical protein
MTIEELFGTLQMSVVAGWRKHLKSAKYGKHIALQEFYEEMPDKVDALIEGWMGAHGKKVGAFQNILTSSNLNTLKYLQELKRVCKEGYILLNDNEELKGLMDDIVNLINSTLYKVKELSESSIMDLADFVMEALNEAKLDSGSWHGDSAWILDEYDTDLVILVGGYSEKEALKIKKLVAAGKDLGQDDDYVLFVDREEWEEQQ